MTNGDSCWSLLLCMEEGASRAALLDAFGAEIHARAADPQEDLLGLLGHLSPDLLLFASPTGGNLATLRGVRAAHPRLPIIVLSLGSTLASEGFLERLGELAVTRFIELPIEADELERRVRGHLASRLDSVRTPESFKRFLGPGEIAFLENDIGRECFIVNAGKIAISKALNRYTLHPLTEVGPGEIFGEMALLSTGRRSATAIAAEESIITVLTQENFAEVMSANPAFALELLDIFVKRYLEARRRLDPSAASAEDDWFHQEASHFSGRPGPRPDLARQEYESGEMILMPGSPAGTLLWVVEGSVQVEPPALGALEAPPAIAAGPDSPLGEVAFLTGEPVDIGAVAKTRTTAVLIPRERFVAAVASRPVICLALVRSLAERVRVFNESLGVREVLELA